MVDAKFNDILTDFTCSAVVNELIKFILYSKQQIPLTYDKLSLAVSRRKICNEESVYKMLSQSERLYKVAEKCVDNLEEIFANVSKEFSNGSTTVSEIAFLFGGSILTPKQVYRVHLPNPVELGHMPKYHSEQLILSDVLKAVVESDELHQMLCKPLEVTNLYLMLRMHGRSESESWLVPKPRYKIPSFGQQIHFNFSFESPERIPCSCKGLQVFSDDVTKSPAVEPTAFLRTHADSDLSEIWCQVPVVFRGFKDVYVQGISVSKYWFPTKCDEKYDS